MLIGLGAELESGKSTIANFLVKKYGHYEFAFAGPMKQMCASIFGLSWEDCYTTEGKERTLESPITLTTDHILVLAQKLLKCYLLNLDASTILKMCERRGAIFNRPRDIFQFMGSEVMRDCIGEDVHVDLTLVDIARAGIPIGMVVFSDARFENERRYIRRAGGKNVLICCPQAQAKKESHRSENSLGAREDYDYILHNDKDWGIDTLEKTVDNMMLHFGVKTIEEQRYS